MSKITEMRPIDQDGLPLGEITDQAPHPGPGSAGQSGDTQDLSNMGDATSQTELELVEEGQAFEAGIVNGIENAANPDDGPVKTREVPEDDVPFEYDEREPGDKR